MVLRRGFVSVLFWSLFLALTITKNTEGNRKTLESFIITKHASEQNSAELAWLNCRRFKGSDFNNPPEENPSSDSKSLSLKTKTLLLHSSIDGDGKGEDCSGWFGGFVGRFLRQRYLTYTVSQSVYRTRPPIKPQSEAAPAASPPVSPSLSPSVPPVSVPSPASNQDLSPPEDVYLPIGMFEFEPPPPSRHQDSHPPLPQPLPPPPPLPSPGPENGNTSDILMFIGAATVSFVVLTSILLCCLTARGKGKGGHRDEKPLLALSSSNYSGCSSQSGSIKLGGLVGTELNGRNGHFSSNSGNQELLSEAAIAAATGASQLKPPPGKEVPPPPEPPPVPPPPPPPPPPKPAPPPPPPKIARPPPVPPKPLPGKIPSNAPKPQRKSSQFGSDEDAESGSQKAKLKPFFWDKTVLTNTDQSMVWNEIRSGSFQFNEEMIETLFGYSNSEKDKSHRKNSSSASESSQLIHIIEAKKAQNLAILLKALNVTTEEVVDALQEGSELPVDLLQILLKVAPTTEEELKLRLFTGDLSQLGPAERFLKVLVDVPFAFQRLDSLLVMCSFQEDYSSVKESLATLEVACNKLRSSRLFLKLLEAVLKTGNRMNDGTYRGGAQAFRLDTLLKLADVKGTDGKTTLLHFVVKEIIRSENARALRTAGEQDSPENHRSIGLEVVSGLSDELEDVRRAAAVDADAVASTVSRLADSVSRTRRFLEAEMCHVNGERFGARLADFVARAEGESAEMAEEEKRTMALVKSTTDYFHGNVAGKDEGLRLFVIVRDFLVMVDKVCREVRVSESKTTASATRSSRNEAANVRASSSESIQSLSDARQRLFPAIVGRRIEDSSSSSDEET